MNISNLTTNIGKSLKSNSPTILTALSICGVIATSYLAAKASAKSVRAIDDLEGREGTAGDRKNRIKERTQLVWKNYIPPVVSGAVTIGCILGANKSNGNKTAAAVAAYSLTENLFGEYRKKVVEELGERKEEKIRDEIAQEHVSKIPSREVVVTTVSGHVLCCELYTGRYFRSDMETLRKAQNDLNVMVNNQIYVSLDEFYDLVGLQSTSNSDQLGWNSDKLMELSFSTVIGQGGEPCLAFEYNYVKPIR